MTRLPRLLALAAALAAALPAAPARAIPGQSTTPNGAAFASACAGNGFLGTTGVGNAPNNGVSSSFGTPPSQVNLTCTHTTSGVGGTAATGPITASGTYGINNNPHSGAAQATITPGSIKLQATNSGSSADGFSGAAAQGGWNDSLTVTGGVPGQQAILALPFHVHGNLSASAQNANALFQVQAYRNNGAITSGSAAAWSLFNNANAEFNPVLNMVTLAEGNFLSSWTSQMLPYAAVHYGASALTVDSLAVDETVWFFVPFTWGTPFTFGLYAYAAASETASGGPVVQNTAVVEFQNTITLVSGAYALPGNGIGPAIGGLSISATSGLDYLAAVPAPPGLAVMGVALVALGWCRKKAVLF